MISTHLMTICVKLKNGICGTCFKLDKYFASRTLATTPVDPWTIDYETDSAHLDLPRYQETARRDLAGDQDQRVIPAVI